MERFYFCSGEHFSLKYLLSKDMPLSERYNPNSQFVICMNVLIFAILFLAATHITVELVGKSVKVNSDMAIFITMNPGYAGRSNLPDNLKKLFRSLAMTQPNRQLIAQVMLYSQGFRTAEKLANKIVPFFK